jgi:hypothetical protein
MADEFESELADLVGLVAAEFAGESDAEFSRALSESGARDSSLQDLRAYLERDVRVVSKFASDGVGIDAAEKDREIVKAALVTLKAPARKRMARDFGLKRTGSAADLLERLVDAIGVDKRRVAELVIEYSDPSSMERRHVSRLVPVDSALTVDEWTSRVGRFTGQYLRTNVAEWFVFGAHRSEPSRFRIEGVLRHYNVSASSVGSVDGDALLEEQEQNDTVVISALKEQPLIRIQSEGEHAADAAARAISFVGDVAPAGRLFPATGFDATGDMSVAPASAWLMSVARAFVSAPETRLEAVTSVTFERDTDVLPGSSKPRIESSRYKGMHVLDTAEICEHLVNGQTLSALAFSVSYTNLAGDVFTIPARITLEKQAVLVATGFGNAGRDVSRRVHAELEDRLADASLAWPLDEEHYGEMVAMVHARATASAEPSTPTIFAPQGAEGAVEAYATA